MNDSEEFTHHERLAFLEKKVEEQEAQIDTLRSAVATLLIDSAFRAKDPCCTRELAGFRDYARQKADAGGTKHLSASFFEHRADGHQWLLDEVASLASAMSGNYRRRSAIGFIDDREYDHAMRMAERLQRLAD